MRSRLEKAHDEKTASWRPLPGYIVGATTATADIIDDVEASARRMVNGLNETGRIGEPSERDPFRPDPFPTRAESQASSASGKER